MGRPASPQTTRALQQRLRLQLQPQLLGNNDHYRSDGSSGYDNGNWHGNRPAVKLVAPPPAIPMAEQFPKNLLL